MGIYGVEALFLTYHYGLKRVACTEDREGCFRTISCSPRHHLMLRCHPMKCRFLTAFLDVSRLKSQEENEKGNRRQNLSLPINVQYQLITLQRRVLSPDLIYLSYTIYRYHMMSLVIIVAIEWALNYSQRTDERHFAWRAESWVGGERKWSCSMNLHIDWMQRCAHLA